MTKELTLLLPLMENCTTITANDIEFYEGRLYGRKVVVAKCGIGKVNAAVTTLTLIEHFHVNMIINTGVAGGAGAEAGVLDVVVANRVAYHDVWCGPGTTTGQAAGCPAFFINPLPKSVLHAIPDVKVGLIASGDIFVSKPEEVEKIKELYPDVMAIDMESAAIAQVCHLKNIPFMAVRVVSDTPGQADNISQYENFWNDAPQSTFAALNHILDIL